MMSKNTPDAIDTHEVNDTAGSINRPLDDSLLEAVTAGFINRNPEADTALTPELIANRDGLTMESALQDELHHCDDFDMSVAFVSAEALKSLFQDFLDFNEHQSRSKQYIAASNGAELQDNQSHPALLKKPNTTPPLSGRIVTSTYNYFNSPDTFRMLLKIQNQAHIEVRVWKGPDDRGNINTIESYPYHPKGYIFRKNEGSQELNNAYIGSSNLTQRALNLNKEWNLKVSALRSSDLIRQIGIEIDEQCQESDLLTDAWIKEYEEEFKQHQITNTSSSQQTDKNTNIKPNAMQAEALMNLADLRRNGESRALIISATGTGKTYLSAFDVKQVHPQRMLYVAQQQQILDKSAQSYSRVLGKSGNTFIMLSGDHKIDKSTVNNLMQKSKTTSADGTTCVFSTIQTLSRPDVLSQFKPDDFDYILIDEAHHSAASSYERITNYLKPDFLLGMTATPERTDDADIFSIFGNNIACEIRLQKALDEDMLCPFHYYGVHEYLKEIPDDEPIPSSAVPNFENVDLTEGKQSDRTNLERALADPNRVKYIADMLQRYGDPSAPVCGLVFCSRQQEAIDLSAAFNEHINEQAERNYRTVAVTSGSRGMTRDEAVTKLESGELDYIFTVDLFNEGVDIPKLNQIVMLRPTQSSIIFTQQLGRGLRKAPGKQSVTVIDFIGNYIKNNYLIPIALYGNTGDRDVARKNLQRQTIGLSSISFDHIARDQVLKSLDTVDLSDMKLLGIQYRQLRDELNRIPMLTDFAKTDNSLVYTLASKKDSYLDFVRSREASLSNGKHSSTAFIKQLEATNDTEDGALKMLTVTQLRGLRPHELEALAKLCDISFPNPSDTALRHDISKPLQPQENTTISVAELQLLIQHDFPYADASLDQCQSALNVLSYSYFTNPSRKRFGEAPIIERVPASMPTNSNVSDVMETNTGEYKLTDWFYNALLQNHTFATFLADTVQAGLSNCKTLYANLEPHAPNLRETRGFIYGEKYSLADVMRLCGWHNEQVAQNVGGYKFDTETNSMPIFIKYEASQYGDRFLSTSDIRWFSKNQRSLTSSEFQWLQSRTAGTSQSDWQSTHFVPVFICRKQDADSNKKAPSYYFVGTVAKVTDMCETSNPPADENGKSAKVVISRLHLSHPVDPQLFKHLTGRPAL